MTLSMNIIKLDYKGQSYRLIDVPGQKKLVSTMCQGSSLAHLAVVVLSARSKEYETSLNQTIEHTVIARGNGITSLLVVVNKMDSICWDRSRYNDIINDFAKKVKHYRFKYINFVPISAIENQNIYNRYNIEYVNESLMGAVENIPIGGDKKMIKPNDKNIKGIFIMNNIRSIIAPGYVCIMHSHDKQYSAKIIHISNHKFLSNNNSKGKQIKMILRLETDDFLSTNVILRKGDDTIGIGLLI